MRRLSWLVGCLVGVSLLGACGAPMDGEQEDGVVTEDARELDASAVVVEVSSAKSALARSDAANVTVKMTNAGSHAVRLLRWNTPVEGVKDALFAISRDGEPVTYLGAHYKRPAPTAGDYLRLAPGESLSATVDLAAVYDLSRTGSYSVRFDLEQQHHGEGSVSALRSDALTLWVEGRQSGPQLEAADGVQAQFGTISYAANCSSTRRSSLSSALSQASSYANNSVSFLNGTPGSRPRYTTWFGAYSSTGWSTVKSHFANIKNDARLAPALHHLVRRLQQHRLEHGEVALREHQERGGHEEHQLRLRLHGQRLRVRVPDAAVQDLPLRRLLERAHRGHRLQGRHAHPRAEPLQRGGGDG
jgi:peptidyl-Lys metalloendopeptidase